MSDEKVALNKTAEKQDEKAKGGVRLKQTDIPSYTLQEALRVPKALWDDCGGKPTAPFHLANSLNITPSGTVWRYLSGSAAAYGLTNGAYNSKEIALTDLGRKLVSEESYDREFLLQAVMMPSVLNNFFTDYNGGKLPKSQIIEAKLLGMGIPKEKTQEAYELVMKNANFVGIIVETKGGSYIHLDAIKDTRMPEQAAIAKKVVVDEFERDESDDVELPDEVLEKLRISKEPVSVPEAESAPLKPRVFISHGKNQTIVEQLKELLKFGQLEPVVEIEHESTAIPVPEKVFGGMQGCQAGIIHIAEEKVLLDKDGNVHKIINENVLIEIGAAMALYKRKVILLCQKGITLPSNLQGLYKCEYEGDQLDYNSIMKLLKTFNELR